MQAVELDQAQAELQADAMRGKGTFAGKVMLRSRRVFNLDCWACGVMGGEGADAGRFG